MARHTGNACQHVLTIPWTQFAQLRTSTALLFAIIVHILDRGRKSRSGSGYFRLPCACALLSCGVT